MTGSHLALVDMDGKGIFATYIIVRALASKAKAAVSKTIKASVYINS